VGSVGGLIGCSGISGLPGDVAGADEVFEHYLAATTSLRDDVIGRR
jgi:hypothetical protein